MNDASMETLVDSEEKIARSQTPPHITQGELADRWRISPRTLERWRFGGIGPAWIKLPGRVLYRAEDVLAYEQVRTMNGGST